MRLDYRVLWFENQPDAVASAAQSLKLDIQSLGFDLSIEWITNYDNIDELISTLAKNKNFDMIFMDWNLGISPDDGATLSHKLRTYKINTDIIFYSSKSSRELRQLMFDNNVDGVFCINRSDLAEDSFGIIENKITRILDINHMRGIVMESVGSLDHHLNEIIEIVYIKSETSTQLKIIDKIKTLINDQSRNSTQKLDDLFNGKTLSLKNALQSYHFSSYLKFRCLVSILKHKKDDPILGKSLNVLSKYNDNVISPRNALAHAISQVDASGHFVLATHNKIYDQAELCEVRKNLLLHRANLKYLNQNLHQIEKL